MAKFYMRLCLKRADKFVEPVDYEVGLVCECVAWVGCRQGDDRGPCRTPCLETRIRVFEDHALHAGYTGLKQAINAGSRFVIKSIFTSPLLVTIAAGMPWSAR